MTGFNFQVGPAEAAPTIETLWTRCAPLVGWIGGGYTRRASGVRWSTLYVRREDAEADVRDADTLPDICRLIEIMVGDTALLTYADIRDVTEDKQLLTVLERGAERRGWIDPDRVRGF